MPSNQNCSIESSAALYAIIIPLDIVNKKYCYELQNAQALEFIGHLQNNILMPSQSNGHGGGGSSNVFGSQEKNDWRTLTTALKDIHLQTLPVHLLPGLMRGENRITSSYSAEVIKSLTDSAEVWQGLDIRLLDQDLRRWGMVKKHANL